MTHLAGHWYSDSYSSQADVWSATYQIVTCTYNRAGGVTSQTYPSQHSVTYNYDPAGRVADKDASNLAFTGNLGDGVAADLCSRNHL